MKILALIPARGGSKGVPNKNIRLFNGLPLLAYSIESAKASHYVDRVIVSTDNEKIAETAMQAGAEVPFLRPAELSRDGSKIVDATIHLLDKMKTDENYEPTHVLLLQPTSPLREARDIDRAVELFNQRDADSLISLVETESWLLQKNENDEAAILPSETQMSSNRQENPKFYKLDGCMIYLIKTEVLRRARSFFAGRLIGYEIEKWRAIDIDEPQDFILAELIHKHRNEIRSSLNNFS